MVMRSPAGSIALITPTISTPLTGLSADDAGVGVAVGLAGGACPRPPRPPCPPPPIPPMPPPPPPYWAWAAVAANKQKATRGAKRFDIDPTSRGIRLFFLQLECG